MGVKYKMFSKIDKISALTRKALRNYNNILEDVIAKKNLAENVKNLLLSMLYKIENSYKDYEKVKRYVKTKDEFLEDTIKLIQNDCNSIEIIDVHKNENGSVINGDIVTEPSEKRLLYYIYGLNNKSNLETYNIENLKEYSLIRLLELGKQMNISETIRDFNGWSWEILKNEIEDIECNLIYQNLLIILERDPEPQDLNNLDEELRNMIEIVAVKILIKNDKNVYNWIEDTYKSLCKEQKLLQNNKEYIEKLTDDKKKIKQEIKEIDELLNNYDLLREKYLEENKKRKKEEKIFSVSRYEEMLQKEKEKFLEELKKCNDLLNPINFIKNKKEIENEIDFIKTIKTKDVLYDIQERFIRLLMIKVNKEDDRKKFISYIYIVRYYSLLWYNDKEIILDKINLSELKYLIIDKAITSNIINKIVENEELNNIIMDEVFKSKIIDLERINIEIGLDMGKLKIRIYDDEMLEKEIELEEREEWKKELLSKKTNKKIKLFS